MFHQEYSKKYPNYEPGISSLRRAIQYMQAYEESEESFEKNSTWEDAFGEKAHCARKKFLKQGPTLYSMARWRMGWFDMVDDFFVIGRHVLRNDFVGGAPKDLSFSFTLSRQKEANYKSTLLFCQDWLVSDGADPSTKTVAWREKWDGTPIVFQDGYYYCAHLSMPATIPYAAELTDVGIYQFYPPDKLESVPWEASLSRWRPWSEFRPSVIREGIIMLGSDGTEYRIKKDPTIELLDFTPVYPGVWEYAHTEDSSLKPIRPRSRPPAKNYAALSKVLALSDLDFTECLKLTTIVSRPVKRIEPKRASKLVLLDEHAYPIVFKDGTKKWDLIGGQAELGETAIQALVREIREESPELDRYIHELPVGDCYVNRSSCASEFVTSMFALKAKTFSLPPTFRPYCFDLDSVPWINRLLVHHFAVEAGWDKDTTYPTETFELFHYRLASEYVSVSKEDLCSYISQKNGGCPVVIEGMKKRRNKRTKQSTLTIPTGLFRYWDGFRRILGYMLKNESLQFSEFRIFHDLLYTAAPTPESSVATLHCLAYVVPFTQPLPLDSLPWSLLGISDSFELVAKLPT